ncbi:MAG: signal peptidase II [Pirellulaceae bacterium]
MNRKNPASSNDQIETRNGVGFAPGTVFSFTVNAILFVVILALGLWADLGTKSYIFANYYSPNTDYQSAHWWVDGIFGIQTSTNPGALFGIGAGYHLLFAAISFVFLGFILTWLLGFGGLRDRWLSICFGMISAGILGNLYDRLGYGHGFGLPEACRNHVRDWILFRLEGVPGFDPWPNFNIADSLLVVGAILLFIHGLLRPAVPVPDSPATHRGPE